MEYRRVMHTSRTKMLAVKAWFLAVLTTMPARIMKAAGVQYKYIEIINTIFSLPAVVCMALIAYYYVRVYFGTRKTTLIEMSINARKRARREMGMAKKTMVLTLSLLICYIPWIIVLLFGKAAPFLRTSSFFSVVRVAGSAELSLESVSVLLRSEPSIQTGNSKHVSHQKTRDTTRAKFRAAKCLDGWR